MPGRFLTLHGMPGSGKSVLAAESVRWGIYIDIDKDTYQSTTCRDPAVTLNNFPGGVFWFKVMMIINDNDVMTIFTILMIMVMVMFMFKVGMVDTDQLLNKLRALCTKLDAPALPTSIEEAQEVLRK